MATHYSLRLPWLLTPPSLSSSSTSSSSLLSNNSFILNNFPNFPIRSTSESESLLDASSNGDVFEVGPMSACNSSVFLIFLRTESSDDVGELACKLATRV
ncbi:hypothetical protein NP493_444g02023 [Ridgeia piscesae]|uniref:Uncharacterized protein n=1 Tax=Ridgeia piscesae TaxID=27915 RepID=A0AAD9KZG1_RIDPI|nr:hypothetical protein NP493_444g02023 [Ridgeia piscesae]